MADIVGDKSPDLVKNDIVTYLALLKALETIGEACKNLAEEFKKSHPEIPWTQIVNFRNHTTHEYWNVRFQTVWRIASIDTPKLYAKITPLIDSEWHPTIYLIVKVHTNSLSGFALSLGLWAQGKAE